MSRDCLRTKNISAPCDGCGARPEVLHMPTKLKGWYCPSCCPACVEPPAAIAGPVRARRGGSAVSRRALGPGARYLGHARAFATPGPVRQ